MKNSAHDNHQKDTVIKKKQPAEGEDLKPDPETLHKTDPQENMKGPVSSVTKAIEKGMDKPDESREEATRKRDRHM